MSIANCMGGENRLASVKPLIGVVEPIPGECLMSVMARTAEKNVFPRVSEMLKSNGIHAFRPEFIPFTREKSAPELSGLLGIETSVISAMMHPASHPERPLDKVNWYGTCLPRRFIEIDRRFSPKSLSSSAHVRAIWQIRPITFCPESLELLITLCPHCGIEVGWRIGRGFHVCGTCGRSLRRGRPGKIDWNVRSHALEVAQLVDPNPEVRAATLRKLPAPFRDWEAGDVFVGAVEMGLAFSFPDREAHKSMSRRTASGDYSDFKVDHLVAGYRAILGWPESFREFLPGVLSDKKGDMHQRMGPFAKYFLWNNNYGRPIGQLLREEVKRTLTDDDLIPFGGNGRRAKWMKRADRLTRNAAAKEVGVEPRLLGRLAREGHAVTRLGAKKDRVFYDPEGLGPSVAIYKSSISTNECARQVGIPAFCVPAIARRGLVTAVTDHDAILMAEEPRYEQKSVTDLVEDLRKRPVCSDRGRRLTVCMEMQFHPDAWVDAINAMLRGEIGVTRTAGRDHSPLFKVDVSITDFESFSSNLPKRTAPEDVTIPSVTAGLLLGIPGDVVTKMIKLNLIRGSFHKSTGIIRMSDLASFSDQHLLGGEGDHRSGRRGFSARMRANGFEPAAVVGKSWIWSRREAEMFLTTKLSGDACTAGAESKQNAEHFVTQRIVQ